MRGRIFDIQRYSVHDGPGIRTTVFVAGCNLRCFWCHNPESLEAQSRVYFNEIKCIGCSKCFEVCPNQCHHMEGGHHRIERAQCNASCGLCAATCWAGALSMTSREEESEQILQTVLLDKPFYKHDGGMTVSGGEPLLQPGFTAALLRGAKEAGFHTAVDTAGCVPFACFEDVLPYTDLFLYDLKCMDDGVHRSATGVSNVQILENLIALSDQNASVIVRIPVVPGVNNTVKNMEETASFIKNLRRVELIDLLTFHGLGAGKYEALGLAYLADELSPLSAKEMERLAEPFKGAGLRAKIS